MVSVGKEYAIGTKNEAIEETEKKLTKRFYECLDSDAEKLFFKVYILFLKEAGKKYTSTNSTSISVL